MASNSTRTGSNCGRQAGTPVPVEPQVFALLTLLVENNYRMVSKDEIVERVWDGRGVSDSAISSRIKSLRRALGDHGKAQRYVRTLHGRGLRFIADVRTISAAAPTEARTNVEAGLSPRKAARPSIAVLPFPLLGDAGGHAAIVDAIPHAIGRPRRN